MSSHGDNVADWQRLLVRQVRDNGRLFYNLAFGVLRDAVASEDVCQQAFLQAWRRRDEIRDHEALRGWLCRTVINECYRIQRRRQTERRVMQRRIDNSDCDNDPAELVARRDLVVTALGELTEPTRTVVTLRTMQGMSGNEVSHTLGISPSEVSRRLHYGLDRLREYIGAERERAEG